MACLLDTAFRLTIDFSVTITDDETTPIDGNLGKEPMLDLLPFASSGRQMVHGD